MLGMADRRSRTHDRERSTRHLRVGRDGETIAAAFLERRGARIVGRNVRVGRDEIDLVVEFAGQRVAVEVKTATAEGRSAEGHDARPEENFDDAKVARIRRAAARLDPPAFRIDLVAIVMDPDGVGVRWSPAAG